MLKIWGVQKGFNKKASGVNGPLRNNGRCPFFPLLAASSASSIRRGGPALPPSCRLDIIFDLEMVWVDELPKAISWRHLAPWRKRNSGAWIHGNFDGLERHIISVITIIRRRLRSFSGNFITDQQRRVRSDFNLSYLLYIFHKYFQGVRSGNNVFQSFAGCYNLFIIYEYLQLRQFNGSVIGKRFYAKGTAQRDLFSLMLTLPYIDHEAVHIICVREKQGDHVFAYGQLQGTIGKLTGIDAINGNFRLYIYTLKEGDFWFKLCYKLRKWLGTASNIVDCFAEFTALRSLRMHDGNPVSIMMPEEMRRKGRWN